MASSSFYFALAAVVVVRVGSELQFVAALPQAIRALDFALPLLESQISSLLVIVDQCTIYLPLEHAPVFVDFVLLVEYPLNLETSC